MIRLAALLIFLLIYQFTGAQIRSGKVVYERKTNVKKVFGDLLPEEWNKLTKKPKKDSFELFFNDSSSLFRPIESRASDPLDWAVSKNSVYTHHPTNTKTALMKFYGENYQLDVLDTANSKWKVTEEKRPIAGFTCIKAFLTHSDGYRIYAWFCPYLNPDVGPEGIGGLPGTILGLALEDGSITYFAKRVEFETPESLVAKTAKNKNTFLAFVEEFKSNLQTLPMDLKLFKNAVRWLTK